MISSAHRFCKGLFPLAIGILLFVQVDDMQAGGSGLNTVVVINQPSTNSCIVGNYYCEQRAVPPENVLRITWTGGNIAWTGTEFRSWLLNPLLEMRATRGLTNQIDFVVLSMDIPYQTIENATNVNSTTSALFYGIKTNMSNGTAELGITNSYGASEQTFRNAQPTSASGSSFLATMMTGNTAIEAKRMITQGVKSDGTFPSQPVVLAKSSDPDRNIRHKRFDNAIFNTKVLDRSSILRTNSDNPTGLTNLLGYQIGLQQLDVSAETFLPGAIADSQTSFGGIIFGANDQTNLLAFITAGATGSYGTVAEPGGDGNDFPDPQVYFYQARGFSLAEAYYQSIDTPYLGLMVAEPLSAPFATPGSGHWNPAYSNATLTGVAPLAVNFRAHDATRPLQRVDLFTDGKYFTTLTNLAIQPSNILTLALNGYPIYYNIPTNSSLGSIANALATIINNPLITNATRVRALASGDRIELQSLSTNHDSFPFYATNLPLALSPGVSYRVRNLTEAVPSRIIPTGRNSVGHYGMQIEIPTALNYVIQATTNLIDWQPIRTNTIPGLIDFWDGESTNYARRFYRVAGPAVNQPPKISGPVVTNGGLVQLRMESQIGQPATILVSTNQTDWTPAETNQAGGVIDWVDTNTGNSSSRFYRAWLPPSFQPSFTLSNSTTETTLIRVDNALQPYTVQFSTNGTDWNGLTTNFTYRDIQTTASSAIGSATSLTTFLHASRATFVTSPACGIEEFRVPASNLASGAWLCFTFTKTNNQTVVVGITNLVAGANATNLAAQIVALIKSNSALESPDGLTVEDFTIDPFQAKFTFRARQPGFPAALLKVQSGRFGLNIFPSIPRTLTKNLSDLQPRNHLYVTTGANQLGLDFLFDTTQLPDGYHELTAIAYEGTSVRTQTRTTIPVCISNSPLAATLTLLDLTNNAPAQATYHIEVSANTNDVNLITLFSTGGPIGFATNNPSATFDVIGTNLCAGLHPFYALVETASGQKFRTETRWIRLQ